MYLHAYDEALDRWVPVTPAMLAGGGGSGGGGDASAANQATGNASLASIDAKVATQTTLAAQAALLGAIAETAPASDTASAGMNGRLQRIAQRLTSLIALLPASLGRKAAANALAVSISTEDLAALVAAATPRMTSTGILRASTSASGGAVWVAYGSQACLQAVLSNQSGALIDIQIGGAGEYFSIPTGSMYPIYGVTNTSQIGLRRRDGSTTQVSCGLNWSA